MEPKPYFDIDFWKSVELINLLGAGSFEEGPVQNISWVACCGYWSEPYSPYIGYPVIFSTVSDCLLWLRWVVLGYACSDGDNPPAETVKLTGIYLEIANEIDQALIESVKTSEEILSLAAEKLGREPEGCSFWIGCITTIHDFMDERGTLEQWRCCLEDEGILYKDGEFIMSPEQWNSVKDYLMSELIDCDTHLPELGDTSEF